MPTAQERFYCDRAEEARRAAADTDLANVRERNLRAADAWQVMADRVRYVERQRAATEERKAALAAAAQ